MLFATGSALEGLDGERCVPVGLLPVLRAVKNHLPVMSLGLGHLLPASRAMAWSRLPLRVILQVALAG